MSLVATLSRFAFRMKYSGKRTQLSENFDFTNSKDYWEQRYSVGGNSGSGSYGLLAEYKAQYISNLIESEAIHSVIEFGCGDGNQLNLISYKSYRGLDVSNSAISICREKYLNKSNYSFDLVKNFAGEQYDLSLSLDVIYHLVEDTTFENHMRDLFRSSAKFVLIYSSDFNSSGEGHVLHRNFSKWIFENAPGFELVSSEENPFREKVPSRRKRPQSSANFYLFKRI